MSIQKIIIVDGTQAEILLKRAGVNSNTPAAQHAIFVGFEIAPKMRPGSLDLAPHRCGSTWCDSPEMEELIVAVRKIQREFERLADMV